MGVGKITKIIVRAVIDKRVVNRKGEKITLSRMKNHTLW